MKSLRSSKAEDIIFAGTQSRKSLGFAECSIVIDNSDGKLPIEYGEVTVTRRLYRSGETGYYINKTPCRLKDILELFMDTGIGKDGYSIIGQGKIDEILSNKSEDRRHIFEEAAGIVKYRTRKMETEKKLEQTKLNLLRINDILTEIEGKIEPLKMQSEKAKKFLNLKEELKNIEIGLFLYNIDTYKQKISEVLKDISIFTSQEEQEESKNAEYQNLKEALKQEIEDLSTKIEQMQNLSFENGNKIETLKAEVQVANQKIEAGKENEARYKEEIVELEKKLQELQEEKEQKLTKRQNLTQNKETFAKELAEKEKQLQTILETLSDKETQLEGKKKKVEENTDLKYEKQDIISTNKANIENLNKQENSLKEEIQSTISELDSKRITKQESTKTFVGLEQKREEMQKALTQISAKKQEADQKTKEYNQKIFEIENQIRMKESKYRFLEETEREKEGYTKSVKSLLIDCEKDSSLGKGVRGVLANLIEVPEKYQVAVEMCLGQTLQNIVTDTEEDAKKLVEHLRANALGRASFLPITSVKGKKLDKLIKNALPGVIGIASDLVKTAKDYEQILLNLLGRTVIVDNMDTAVILARQNNYSFRIVTLKGDIISSSGSITGGFVATKTVNILGRKREIETLAAEIKDLKEMLDRLKQEKENYEDGIEDVLEEAAGLEKQVADTEIVYATEKQKILLIEEEVQKLEKRLQNQREKQEQIATEKENANLIKERALREIEVLDKENEELTKTIQEFSSYNKEKQNYIDDLNFDITNLKISVSSFDESQNSIDEIMQRIDDDIAASTKSVDNKHLLCAKIAEEREALKQNIEENMQKQENAKQEVDQSKQKIENLKHAKTEKTLKQEENEKQQDEILKIVNDLKEQISKLEIKKSKMEVELEQIVNKMWEDYEMTPNAAIGYEKPDNIASTTKQVNSLRTQIKDLGSVNVDAIEEYKQTKERYDFVCEQRLDLENSSAKLRKLIGEMTNTMKEQFSEQFKIINKNFGEVFTELFGGGKAELKLADEENILECGIDIEVQPPGKKLQNMMLLSGGEKAFTAIALLFAILKINPAPFCVLDEIEAALDDVNVYRFADYIKKFVKETQFLVITHRKGTMEAADTVYGITMEESGISKLLSMKLK